MTSKTIWMVRAGEGGYLFEEFKARSLVAVGWNEMGDMSSLKTREQFVGAVSKHYPDLRKMQIAISAGQAFRFVREIRQGDRVMTYDPARREYLVGEIIGDYVYDRAAEAIGPQSRKVRWEGEVKRDALSVATRNSLGAIASLFQLPAEAAEEIERLIAGHPPKTVPTLAPEEDETQVELLFRDVQSKAFEFIKDKIRDALK